LAASSFTITQRDLAPRRLPSGGAYNALFR
jgi:hypothetical protein